MNFYHYRAELERVVDGDTYDFIVDLGFHTYKRIRIRMIGVDTHETYGVPKESDEYAKGMEEKRYVEQWFETAEGVRIKTEKDEQGKYGRWLARVYNDEGECLNDRLVEVFDVGA